MSCNFCQDHQVMLNEDSKCELQLTEHGTLRIHWIGSDTNDDLHTNEVLRICPFCGHRLTKQKPLKETCNHSSKLVNNDEVCSYYLHTSAGQRAKCYFFDILANGKIRLMYDNYVIDECDKDIITIASYCSNCGRHIK